MSIKEIIAEISLLEEKLLEALRDIAKAFPETQFCSCDKAGYTQIINRVSENPTVPDLYCINCGKELEHPKIVYY